MQEDSAYHYRTIARAIDLIEAEGGRTMPLEDLATRPERPPDVIDAEVVDG